MKYFFRFQIYFLIILMHTYAFSDTFRANDRKEASGQYVSDEFLAVFFPLKQTVLSTEISGKVINIFYEMGDTFQKNALLIEIDPSFYKAEKKKADAAVVSATTDYNAKKILFKQKSVSEVEFINSKAGFKAAKANAEIARKKLSACKVNAPYTGKIVKVYTKENEFIAEGQSLVEIIDSRIIRAKFFIPSSYYDYIHVDQIFKVRVNEIEKDFQCRITNISPVLEPNTSSFQVFAEIINNSGSIRSGMTGYVIIKEEE